jgi:hypothetical protein
MNKNVALALIAGLVGGLATRYIAPPTAFAQNQAPATPKEVRAQSFTLVDQTDRSAGTFRVEAMPGQFSPNGQLRTRIVLRDSGGREIWSAGGSAFQPVTER